MTATTTTRCPLCGAHSAGSYCAAHTWAAGPAPEPKRRSNLTSLPAGHLGTVGSRSKSPAGRTSLPLKSVSASNRQPRED